jgi:hypothetical protein
MSPVEAQFHADRRTDGQENMTKLTVAISNFADAPKKLEKKNSEHVT